MAGIGGSGLGLAGIGEETQAGPGAEWPGWIGIAGWQRKLGHVVPRSG